VLARAIDLDKHFINAITRSISINHPDTEQSHDRTSLGVLALEYALNIMHRRQPLGHQYFIAPLKGCVQLLQPQIALRLDRAQTGEVLVQGPMVMLVLTSWLLVLVLI